MSNKNICPWWMGYLLLIPLRKLSHNPVKILKPYIKEGMTVIDYGCAMGYFSLPMAKMVGRTGKVYCFDIQEKMLQQLSARAEKAGLTESIKPMLIAADENTEHLKNTADFALLFAVAHEVENQDELFARLAGMLKPKAQLLFAEPKGHVSLKAFKLSIQKAVKCGFTQKETLEVGKGYAVLLEKE
jgi:2-polyprenyl-3-methyl-5-hydroxy-6-metoxy-1,4-benzoquinol methylase